MVADVGYRRHVKQTRADRNGGISLIGGMAIHGASPANSCYFMYYYLLPNDQGSIPFNLYTFPVNNLSPNLMGLCQNI